MATSSEIIKKHLETMIGQKEFDADFVNILIVSNIENEDGEEIAAKIINLIKKRYAQSKKNNS